MEIYFLFGVIKEGKGGVGIGGWVLMLICFDRGYCLRKPRHTPSRMYCCPSFAMTAPASSWNVMIQVP